MSEKKINDAGEFIAGARKHSFGKGLHLLDIEGLNDIEASRLMKKEIVWPNPDWSRLHADGVSAETLAVVKVIRESIPNKPVIGYEFQKDVPIRDIYEKYITIVNAIKSACESAIDSDNTSTIDSDVKDAIKYKEKGARDREIRLLHLSIYKSNTPAYYVDFSKSRKVEKLIAEGFPNKKAVPIWLKGVVFQTNSEGKIRAHNKTSYLSPYLDSEQDVKDYLENKYNDKKSSKLKIPPKYSSHKTFTRDGLKNYRSGDFSAEKFIETFGFRGVQFGESVPDIERQHIINSAADALFDLADVLGVDPIDLSLDGTLAASFGARGIGGFPAHYEPAQRVFNITRVNGAGSLAHEWAHAFDHYTAITCGQNSIHKVISFASDSISLTNLDDDVIRIWDDIKSSFKKIAVSPEAAIKHYQDLITGCNSSIEKSINNMTLFPSYERRFKKEIEIQHTQIAALELKIKSIEENPESSSMTRFSNFFMEARKLNGTSGDYWTRPHELFARAFECTVFDEIKNRNGSSGFLVQGVEDGTYSDSKIWKGDPYPSGEERNIFNSKIAPIVRTTLENIRRISASPAI